MPRYNVQNEKGEWACFSSIVDDFVTEFMPREEYQAWRIKEYGIHCGEIEEANQMDYEEAMIISLCKKASNKGYNLDDVPEYGDTCDYCKFWNKETKCCDIVKRQDEVEQDGCYHS